MRDNNLTVLLPVVSAAPAMLAPGFVDSVMEGQDTSACPPAPKAWAGSSRNLKDYHLFPGYPASQSHPRYFGLLSGTRQEIGRQCGERTGELFRTVFEGWFTEVAQDLTVGRTVGGPWEWEGPWDALSLSRPATKHVKEQP